MSLQSDAQGEKNPGFRAAAGANGKRRGEHVYAACDAPVDWAALVAGIRANEPAAIEQLYFIFSQGFRAMLRRRLESPDTEDKLHDLFLILLQAIRNGNIRDPDRLMGFARTIARRQIAGYINEVAHRRQRYSSLDEREMFVPHPTCTPEQSIIARNHIAIVDRVLSELSTRHQEILTRVYIQDQSQEQVCAEMRLTETQFRLLKSRAKLRFADLGKRKIMKNSTNRFYRHAPSCPALIVKH
jgi:RNA polymerase sigma-70 factor, ECF subfamily